MKRGIIRVKRNMMRAADLQYGDFVGIAWALNDFIPSMIYCF